VKIFPAMPAGPEYLKAIHAPLPQIPLVAVGGVTHENMASFFKAGACGVAGASNLADPKLVKAGRFDEITQIATAWLKTARVSRE
jgi:2-dehydro-3-deoxyphosphogluconate aldolase/(4S)-4-hydroxy-2-oxoglutarate aldolase